MNLLRRIQYTIEIIACECVEVVADLHWQDVAGAAIASGCVTWMLWYLIVR